MTRKRGNENKYTFDISSQFELYTVLYVYNVANAGTITDKDYTS